MTNAETFGWGATSRSAAAAGDIIGGGPRAFQKYEAGDLLPSRAISSALARLEQDPGAIRILSAAGNGAEFKDGPD